jgi:hypothetical protein
VPDDGFVAFVRDAHEGLLCLADLLEEEPPKAEALVRTALVDTRVRWRRLGRSGDPAGYARARLIRRHVGPRSDGGPASGIVDEPTCWADGSSDGLRRELSGLPARTRAAVVLRLHEQLPDEEIARLLRTDQASVRTGLTHGLARLEQALAPEPVRWGAPAPAPTGADLRHELRLLVEGVARPPFDAVAAADSVSREAAARRRRRWLTGTAAAAALALAVVLGLPGDGPPAGERPADVAAGAPAEAARVHDLPTRGSLADDSAFLDGLLALPWENETIMGVADLEVAAADSRRVVFAGEVPGRRWALVVGTPSSRPSRNGPETSGGLVAAWFTGPPGAAPDQMTMSSFPRGISPDLPVSLLDPRTGTLVLVAAPGDVVEVSTGSVIAADGYRSRPYEAAETTEGIATTRLDLGDAALPWAVSYRVVRGDRIVMTSAPEGVVSPSAEPELPSFDISYPRGLPDPGAAEAAQTAAVGVMAPLGLSPEEADIVAHWTGPLPGSARGSLVVMTVTVPSGAVVATALWQAVTMDGLGSYAADCGLEIRPAGVPTDQRVLAAGCDIHEESSGAVVEEVLVVVAPPSVTRLRAYDGSGRFLADLPIGDGVMVGAMPPGTQQVEAETVGGVLLGRTELLGRDQLWD